MPQIQAAAIAIIASALATVTACGGSGDGTAAELPAAAGGSPAASSRDATEPSLHNAAKAYLQMTAPVSKNGKATVAFNKAIDRYNDPNDDFSQEDLASAAASLATIIEELDGKLLRYAWPSSVRADIRADVRDTADLIGALRALTGSTDIDTWNQDMAAANARARAASNIVRADLGLPPLSQ